MKGRGILFLGAVIGVIGMIAILSVGCSKEEGPAVITVPNPDAGPAKLLSEIEITQDPVEGVLSVKEVGVPDPETGKLLSPEATEITSGITYTIVPGSCTANAPPNVRTCCQLNITNNTGATINSVILVGDQALSGSPVAARTGGSGTGYDGSGTGWANIDTNGQAAANGGYALWMVRSASGNAIGNTQTSDNRTICIQSNTGYSISRWRLYKDAILGKIVDRNTGSAITSGGWAMLGSSSPDNTNFPELGSGNFTDTDAQGNFGFPYLGTTVTSFTVTAGATNYARQTIIGTTNRNITLKLKSRTLNQKIAAGNYNNTLAVINPNPAVTVGGNCTLTTNTNIGCEGFVVVGVMLPSMGYEDVASLSLESLIGPNQQVALVGDTGTCSVGSHTSVNLDMPLPSNVLLPRQNEGPLTAAGYTNVYANIPAKLEWWTPAPASTNNATFSSIWGQVPRSAISALAVGALNGGPISIVSLVTGINPVCTGWIRNITTSATNYQGIAFSIDRSNSNFVITLGNMPASTPPRTVLSLMGVEFANNPASVKLTAISLGGGNTTSANVVMPSSNQTLDGDANLIPMVIIADLDKSANTLDKDAVIAIASRPGTKGFANTTFNTFFTIPSLTWSSINGTNRRVAFANPERAIGTAGGSPWVDASVAQITKTTYTNTITEETSSCGTGTCCDKKDANNRCQYDQNATETLWEVLTRGRTSTTTGPVTDWVLPTPPGTYDLPPGNPTGYSDKNYPSLTVFTASWCPGSPLCTANATTNEFLFDNNDNIDTLLNNVTHFATNKFGLGEARIINPRNQYNAAGATSVTLNGFIAAGNWNVVSCNYVFIKKWNTYRNSTSKAEECGTSTGLTCCTRAAGCPCTPGGTCNTGADCTATTPFCCPTNRACGFVTVQSAGGCGASLPPYCFTTSIPTDNNRWTHVEVDPINSTTNATCGEGSGEWYILNGNPG